MILATLIEHLLFRHLKCSVVGWGSKVICSSQISTYQLQNFGIAFAYNILAAVVLKIYLIRWFLWFWKKTLYFSSISRTCSTVVLVVFFWFFNLLVGIQWLG
jgi:hypothetical protein